MNYLSIDESGKESKNKIVLTIFILIVLNLVISISSIALTIRFHENNKDSIREINVEVEDFHHNLLYDINFVQNITAEKFLYLYNGLLALNQSLDNIHHSIVLTLNQVSQVNITKLNGCQLKLCKCSGDNYGCYSDPECDTPLTCVRAGLNFCIQYKLDCST